LEMFYAEHLPTISLAFLSPIMSKLTLLAYLHKLYPDDMINSLNMKQELYILCVPLLLLELSRHMYIISPQVSICRPVDFRYFTT